MAVKRLNIYVDEEFHKLLKIRVAEQGTSVLNYVVEAVKERYEKETKVIKKE